MMTEYTNEFVLVTRHIGSLPFELKFISTDKIETEVYLFKSHYSGSNQMWSHFNQSHNLVICNETEKN